MRTITHQQVRATRIREVCFRELVEVMSRREVVEPAVYCHQWLGALVAEFPRYRDLANYSMALG